jgi:hypothetical protein
MRVVRHYGNAGFAVRLERMTRLENSRRMLLECIPTVPRFGNKYVLPQRFHSVLCYKSYQQIQMLIEYKVVY